MHAQISRMIRSMAWADEQVVATLRGCPDAQAEALPLLSHVLGAEHIWLSRLRRQDPSHPVWPTMTLDECEQLVRENADGFSAYLRETAEVDLGGLVAYRNSKGSDFEATPIDILTHVVVHGSYHRGQVARVLKPFGVQATSTDFIAFALMVEPTRL